MRNGIVNRVRVMALVACVALASACAAAAAGAAGAAAGMYLSGNSATGTANASLATVDGNTRTALGSMGISVTKRTTSEGSVEYRGTGNGEDIGVKLEDNHDGTTKVTVSARKSPVEWDNSYARDIVNRIVQG